MLCVSVLLHFAWFLSERKTQTERKIEKIGYHIDGTPVFIESDIENTFNETIKLEKSTSVCLHTLAQHRVWVRFDCEHKWHKYIRTVSQFFFFFFHTCFVSLLFWVEWSLRVSYCVLGIESVLPLLIIFICICLFFLLRLLLLLVLLLFFSNFSAVCDKYFFCSSFVVSIITIWVRVCVFRSQKFVGSSYANCEYRFSIQTIVIFSNAYVLLLVVLLVSSFPFRSVTSSIGRSFDWTIRPDSLFHNFVPLWFTIVASSCFMQLKFRFDSVIESIIHGSNALPNAIFS